VAAKPALFDTYQLEYLVVRTRNELYFRLGPKGDRRARKIFVIGHPRTGTGSLHRLFLQNGVHSLHSPGNWNTAKYEAFSDRGNYQPFQLFDRYYEDSVFVLNTRPAYRYVKSRLNQTAKSRQNKQRRSAKFTERNIENEIVRRNNMFLQAVRHFHGKSNLIVINIERPGAFDFLCGRLGFENRAEVSKNRSPRQVLSQQDLHNIDRAFQRLGIEDEKENTFIIPQLLDRRERHLVDDFLARPADTVYL